LRQCLTINLIEGAPWQETELIMKEIAVLMEVSAVGINETLQRQIIIPDI
jgi:hypothetical protein